MTHPKAAGFGWKWDEMMGSTGYLLTPDTRAKVGASQPCWRGFEQGVI